MKIDRIAYEQLYPTGVYANQRYRVEIVLEPHDFENRDLTQIDVAKDAFKKAKDTVEKIFTEMNPQINWASNPQFYNLGVTIPSEEKESPTGLTVDDINSCQDKSTLESYRLLVRNKPELEAAFLSKLKEFI